LIRVLTFVNLSNSGLGGFFCRRARFWQKKPPSPNPDGGFGVLSQGQFSPMFRDSSRGKEELSFGVAEFPAPDIRDGSAQRKGGRSSRIGCTGNGFSV
jgi:hypothetical protein